MYQEVMDSSGRYPIEEHLLAMKAGYKASHLSYNLRDNVGNLKFNRNAAAQALVLTLVDMIPAGTRIDEDCEEIIEELIDAVKADKIINNTSHTFEELDDDGDDDNYGGGIY